MTLRMDLKNNNSEESESTWTKIPHATTEKKMDDNKSLLLHENKYNKEQSHESI